MTNPQPSWILFSGAEESDKKDSALTGLEWLPDTTITDSEWSQAKDIAAFLVDLDTLLDRALN